MSLCFLLPGLACEVFCHEKSSHEETNTYACSKGHFSIDRHVWDPPYHELSWASCLFQMGTLKLTFHRFGVPCFQWIFIYIFFSTIYSLKTMKWSSNNESTFNLLYYQIINKFLLNKIFFYNSDTKEHFIKC